MVSSRSIRDHGDWGSMPPFGVGGGGVVHKTDRPPFVNQDKRRSIQLFPILLCSVGAKGLRERVWVRESPEAGVLKKLSLAS